MCCEQSGIGFCTASLKLHVSAFQHSTSPSWMRNYISRSVTSEHTQEGENQLPDRHTSVHFIKVSELTLLVIQCSLASHLYQPESQLLFSSPCLGSKFDRAAKGQLDIAEINATQDDTSVMDLIPSLILLCSLPTE